MQGNLTERKEVAKVSLEVEENCIRIKRQLKYLEVVLNTGLRGIAHTQYAAG